MLRRKNFPAVCIVTSNNETCRLALGALGKLRKKVLLFLCGSLSRRDVRRMGYRGPLSIINKTENPELALIDEIAKLKNPPEWMIFINETDMLVSIDIPNVPEKHFAVMNNRVVIYGGLTNLLRVMTHPCDYTIDNKNVVLQRPMLDVSGAFLRTKHVLNARDTIDNADNILSAMQAANPTGSPIYMDTTNIVEIRRNFGSAKRHSRDMKKSTNL